MLGKPAVEPENQTLAERKARWPPIRAIFRRNTPPSFMKLNA